MDDAAYEAMLNTEEKKYNQDLLEQITKNIALDVDKFSTFECKRRAEKHKVDSWRNGPAPIEESVNIRKSKNKPTYGTLDSDLEDLDFEELRTSNQTANYFNKVRITKNERGDNLASCRALIVYFSKLAKTRDDEEVIDLNFVESLIEGGADINFPDRHGQTVLHEIARGWNPDIAKFALQNGADINKADGYGRTPLHLAAAVNYEEMVEFLVDNGADLTAQTIGELQTPMHYAAKNNATNSLKVMLRLGAHINDRDYKKRTPLFVAAETARAEAARFLIEKGAPAGVYDSSGTPCLSLMIEKMPQIAIEAVEQFHLVDRAFRKHYYYLSYLEADPAYLVEYIPEDPREKREHKERMKAEKKLLKERGQKVEKKEKSYAKTPLEVIVQYNQLDLIMHPVFQRLLHVKWALFGKWGSAKLLALNMIYTLIWTTLGITIPRDRKYYTPFVDNWWRLVLELIGVIMTVYLIFTEVYQVRIIESAYNKWRQWRSRHMEKDLQYCHPRWPEESQYLTSELEQIRSYQRAYFRDPWNIFEWAAYMVVLALVLTRILSVASGNKSAEEVHPRVYALGLIVIWLRFMRSCRVFRTLGPFIAILGSVISDTLKFAFLFFEFFIPYTCGFWILFGGHLNAHEMGDDSRINYEQFNDLTYSVWMMTLMGPFDWPGLAKIDRLMAQILCGTYFALAGVVCMNLYIALLSDTFARVYAQAQANAVMQQARIIILLEAKLNKFKISKFGHYMQRECSPQEVYTRDEPDEDHSQDMFEKVVRQLSNRINELEDNLYRNQNTLLKTVPQKSLATSRSSIAGGFSGGNFGGSGGGGAQGGLSANWKFDSFAQKQSDYNKQIKYEMAELKTMMNDIKSVLLTPQGIVQRNTTSGQQSIPSQPLPTSINQTSSNMPNQPQATNFYNQSSPRKGSSQGTDSSDTLSITGGNMPFVSPQTPQVHGQMIQSNQHVVSNQQPYTPNVMNLTSASTTSIPNGNQQQQQQPRLQRSMTMDRFQANPNIQTKQNIYPTLPLANTHALMNSSFGQSLDTLQNSSDKVITDDNIRPQSRSSKRRRRKKKNSQQFADQDVPLNYMNLSTQQEDSIAVNLPLLQSQIDQLNTSADLPV